VPHRDQRPQPPRGPVRRRLQAADVVLRDGQQPAGNVGLNLEPQLSAIMVQISTFDFAGYNKYSTSQGLSDAKGNIAPPSAGLVGVFMRYIESQWQRVANVDRFGTPKTKVCSWFDQWNEAGVHGNKNGIEITIAHNIYGHAPNCRSNTSCVTVRTLRSTTGRCWRFDERASIRRPR
jgi:hypothetical protein